MQTSLSHQKKGRRHTEQVDTSLLRQKRKDNTKGGPHFLVVSKKGKRTQQGDADLPIASSVLFSKQRGGVILLVASKSMERGSSLLLGLKLRGTEVGEGLSLCLMSFSRFPPPNVEIKVNDGAKIVANGDGEGGSSLRLKRCQIRQKK